MFKRSDFTVKKIASGWAVIRSDSAILGLGFMSKKEAADWMDAELSLAGI